MKIYLDIVNSVIYKHLKFQYEILCIVGYKKWQNLIQFIDLKIDLDLHVCLFLQPKLQSV
jgi:hypothetical protein